MRKLSHGATNDNEQKKKKEKEQKKNRKRKDPRPMLFMLPHIVLLTFRMYETVFPTHVWLCSFMYELWGFESLAVKVSKWPNLFSRKYKSDRLLADVDYVP